MQMIDSNTIVSFLAWLLPPETAGGGGYRRDHGLLLNSCYFWGGASLGVGVLS